MKLNTGQQITFAKDKAAVFETVNGHILRLCFFIICFRDSVRIPCGLYRGFRLFHGAHIFPYICNGIVGLGKNIIKDNDTFHDFLCLGNTLNIHEWRCGREHEPFLNNSIQQDLLIRLPVIGWNVTV